MFYEGVSGEEFAVGRLSQPRLLIRAESGNVIKTVMLNNVDVTALLHGGYLDLTPVYEDKVITVTTEDETAAPKDTYTVKGKVTLNGQPLAEVDLELRSILKTTKTDKNGNFAFTDAEPGKHSLTALKDGKVIGYLSFELKKDSKSDVVLLDNGTYIVSVDQNGAGGNSSGTERGKRHPCPNRRKNREKGSPDTSQTGDNTNLSWWWLLLILSATCVVVLETYRRKKKA